MTVTTATAGTPGVWSPIGIETTITDPERCGVVAIPEEPWQPDQWVTTTPFDGPPADWWWTGMHWGAGRTP